MIPQPIDYTAPATVAEALAVLGDTPGSRLLAGGQSLLADLQTGDDQARTLVDLRRIGSLRGIRADEHGNLQIGASSTLDDLASDPLVRGMAPALAEAAGAVGDPQLRNRATVAGNLASAARGTDLPAAALALGVRVMLTGPAGDEVLSAEEFFAGDSTGRLITAVAVDARPPGSRSAFEKLAHRAITLPVSAVGVELTWSAAGTAETVRIGLSGPTERPVRLTRVEDALVGTQADQESVVAAFTALPERLFVRVRGMSVEYLKHVTGVLAARAVRRTANLT